MRKILSIRKHYRKYYPGDTRTLTLSKIREDSGYSDYVDIKLNTWGTIEIKNDLNYPILILDRTVMTTNNDGEYYPNQKENGGSSRFHVLSSNQSITFSSPEGYDSVDWFAMSVFF